MNIGIVTSWFERGAAYLSRAFMDGFARYGHKTFIFARGGEDYDYSPDWKLANVFYSSSRAGTCDRCKYTGIADLEEFERWLRDNRIDVVAFNEQLDPEPMVRCQKLGVKRLMFGLAYVMPMDFYREHFDKIICHTELTYRIFRETGVAELVRWGVDPDKFAPGGKNLTSEQAIFFHNAGMSFGNLRKGTPALLKAWSRIPKKLRSQAKLIIHTQQPWEIMFEQLPELRSVVEGEPTIESFVGTSKPPSGYHLGNIYAYPACIDSLGLTITEAMACGMPVITTAAAPFDEFVKDQVNGLLVRARKRPWSDSFGAPDQWGYYDVTVDDLVSKLRFFIENRAPIIDMGKQSRQRVENDFNFWKNFARADQIVRELAAR